MSESTERCGTPLISILMAVYEPRMDWLREQLNSLEAQTYPNLRLYIRDDCSPTVPFEAIQALVKDCIHSFPYTISRNEENVGSNQVFERLTREAEGEYFAYCDQDDVWLPEKLEKLERILSQKQSRLVCSDVQVIDASGEKLADSITQVRRRHIFYMGGDLSRYLLYHNFVMGCTMLIYAEQAKAALPFIPGMVHDHYLALFCAVHRGVAVSSEQLIRYRIHTDNQSNVLAGIDSTEDYYESRILPFYTRGQAIRTRLDLPAIDEMIKWASARVLNYQRKDPRPLWRLRHVDAKTSLFEIIMLRMPQPIFRFGLWILKRGMI